MRLLDFRQIDLRGGWTILTGAVGEGETNNMNFWRFMDGTYEPSAALQGSYDPWLVLLSFLVASMAGYAALNVAAHIGAMEMRHTRRAWLVIGALAMGTGIWAMHFIGMLAFSLPLYMSYDLVMTMVSVVPAVLGSGLALAVMSRAELHQRDLWGGALLMASGIGAMHYTGMEAMQMDAELRYDPWMFAASIVVAHFLAMLALSTKFMLSRSRHRDSFPVKLATAALMGGAVTGMHYTGMAAAYFFPREDTVVTGSPMDTTLMVSLTTVVTILVLGVTIYGAILDSWRVNSIRLDMLREESMRR